MRRLCRLRRLRRLRMLHRQLCILRKNSRLDWLDCWLSKRPAKHCRAHLACRLHWCRTTQLSGHCAQGYNCLADLFFECAQNRQLPPYLLLAHVERVNHRLHLLQLSVNHLLFRDELIERRRPMRVPHRHHHALSLDPSRQLDSSVPTKRLCQQERSKQNR